MEADERRVMDSTEVPDVEEVKVDKDNTFGSLDQLAGVELLSREDILEADDTRYALVDVSEWNNGRTTKVLVKSLQGAERDALEDSMMVGKGKNTKMSYTNFRAKLCAKGIIDSKGNRLFTEKDVAALGRKNAAALSRVTETITKLSGISKEDVDEMVGNSDSEAGEDS